MQRAGIAHQFPEEFELRQEQLPNHIPTEEHEEEDAEEGGDQDQHGQPDALQHVEVVWVWVYGGRSLTRPTIRLTERRVE